MRNRKKKKKSQIGLALKWVRVSSNKQRKVGFSVCVKETEQQEQIIVSKIINKNYDSKQPAKFLEMS